MHPQSRLSISPRERYWSLGWFLLQGGSRLEVLAQTCGSCSTYRLTPLDWTWSRHYLHTQRAKIYNFTSSPRVLQRRPAGNDEIVPHTEISDSSWQPIHFCAPLCFSSSAVLFYLDSGSSRGMLTFLSVQLLIFQCSEVHRFYSTGTWFCFASTEQ